MSSFPEQRVTLVSSRKAAAAFFGVFLIGVLVGALNVAIFRNASVPRLLTSTGDPKSMAERIDHKYASELHLSADEQKRIAPLIREMTQHLYLVRRQFGVDIIATLDDYHAKIAEQMTPEHRAAYEKANVERKQRLSTVLLLNPEPGTTDTK